MKFDHNTSAVMTSQGLAELTARRDAKRAELTLMMQQPHADRVRDAEGIQQTLLNEMNRVITHCVVNDSAPTDTDCLQIGHIATFTRSDMPGEQKWTVGSWGSSDSARRIMGYNLPLIAELVGQNIGYESDIMLNGKAVVVTLVNIEMPVTTSEFSALPA